MNTDQDNQEDIQEGEDQVAVIDTEDDTQEPLENVATNLHVRNVIETLLYVNEKPITLEQFKKVLPTVTGPEIKRAVKHLIDEYEARNQGMVVVELGGGFQMLSNPHFASYVRDFYKTKHKEKLSKPALEALAIIAYKQPVTRADIEIIRGVNSDGVVVHLINKELIKVVGRKDVPGRPFIYGTTKQFLEYFGLKSIDNLPKLEEFPSLIPDEDKEEEGSLDILDAVEGAAVASLDASIEYVKENHKEVPEEDMEEELSVQEHVESEVNDNESEQLEDTDPKNES